MRLYLRRAPSGGKIMAIKALREALRVIDPDAKAHQADILLDALDRDGYALMAHADPRTLARMTDLIEDAGGHAVVVNDAEAERTERHWRSRRAARDGASPEDVFAAEAPSRPAAEAGDPAPEYAPCVGHTATALMAFSDGNPVTAALYAQNLARTTQDASLYNDVIRYLAHVFPWIESPLRENGSWPS